jgi:hypothetical protein
MWRPHNLPKVKLYYLDCFGWPVETIKGRPVTNFIRLLIHTCRITTNRPIALDATSAGCVMTQYKPMFEPPTFDFPKDQKSFHSNVGLFLPMSSWTRPGLIGPIDAMSEMMKPEEK